MIFDHVSFNTVWAASLTKDEFVKFHQNQFLWPGITDKERRAKLGQAWDLIQAQHKRNANYPESLNGKPKAERP